MNKYSLSFVTLALCAAAAAQCTPSWKAMPSLADAGSEVQCFATFDDGSGPALYGGGSLLSSGASAGNIYRLSGGAWQMVGGGANGLVAAMCVFDDGSGPSLFVAGTFTSVGGVPARGIARWDGQAWHAVDSGIGDLYPSGRSLLVFDDDGPGPRPAALYMGGLFQSVGGVQARNIARWDGQAWMALGTGADDYILDMAAFDEDGAGSAPARLFIAGNFQSVGGQATKGIARWNGSAWSSVAGGLGTFPWAASALEVFDDGSGPALYVGGSFDNAGGVPAARVARWNGAAWSGTQYPLGNAIHALAVVDEGNGSALYAGGSRHLTDPGRASVARLRSGWTLLPGYFTGTSNPAVRALHAYDADGPGGRAASLVVGGQFYAVNGIISGRVAEWSCPAAPSCYANCDSSTAEPRLNVGDFTCFLQRFAAGDAYANCDQSTAAPVLNVGDFTCFLQRFAAGCP
jgi:trimeric autotransporter adhesin